MSPEGLPGNSVVRITDRPDMTTAVYRGRKALNQTKQSSPMLFPVISYPVSYPGHFVPLWSIRTHFYFILVILYPVFLISNRLWSLTFFFFFFHRSNASNVVALQRYRRQQEHKDPSLPPIQIADRRLI